MKSKRMSVSSPLSASHLLPLYQMPFWALLAVQNSLRKCILVFCLGRVAQMVSLFQLSFMTVSQTAQFKPWDSICSGQSSWYYLSFSVLPSNCAKTHVHKCSCSVETRMFIKVELNVKMPSQVGCHGYVMQIWSRKDLHSVRFCRRFHIYFNWHININCK